ncbi:phage tail sheath subtilisin-like domain-containing protein [Endozoicomonas gorgoniicola]|uniref:Phage tail sheath subtilisin-like domain-containing protein n=1 Tax=Endozoicomonas gorgoniicola TaxID=1234144 RepID=A0ABT3MWB5_9GAMM|nr:phage tail sheath subtilisin-like domain-containing protein [Endozoicomonas gorgoniicola]MCW7553645.1 phage tail sheath subtilisin-like domain-containing protein [Endozoicomonas gorgoniicola]
MPQFRHGIYGATSEAGPRPVPIAPTGTICIVGTADDADENVFPLNTPVLIPGSPLKAAKLDTKGQRVGTLLPAVEMILAITGAIVVVIRVAEGSDDADTRTKVIGETTADGKRTGLDAVFNVQAMLGYKPRVLIAPGFSNDEAVATKLQTVADRLRAYCYADAPGSTETSANAYRQKFGSRRLEVTWPRTINTKAELVPMSAVAAGLRAKVDNTPWEEYSASISNWKVLPIIGTEFPVDFQDGDDSCLAYILNSNQISTIINDGGLRYWGNLNCSDDPKWQFATHVRINDIILDSSTAALKWARDRKINKTFVEDVLETQNNFIARETRAKNLLGGKAWADPELNSPDVILAGEFYMDYEFTPPGIAQAITITSHFVNDYAKAIFR